MGRRSDFERVGKDYYRTWDKRAIMPLLPHLAPNTRYIEPCAGDGSLIDLLAAHGHTAAMAFDIEPHSPSVAKGDAFELDDLAGADCILTNPPWSRPILHRMIGHFASLGPCWLLFDHEWPQTKQSIPYMDKCEMIVAVGRVRWMEGTKMDGKDSCSWYKFDDRHSGGPRFVGRRA